MTVEIVKAKKDDVPKMLTVLRERERNAIVDSPTATAYLERALSSVCGGSIEDLCLLIRRIFGW